VSDIHRTLHSPHTEVRALAGEHRGRAENPVIKVEDLAWLEFEKTDLEHARDFACAFGFAVAAHTPDWLQLRGANAGPPCMVIRRGSKSRFIGAAFKATEPRDLQRLADATGKSIAQLPEPIGGRVVDLTAPDGTTVRVVNGVHALPALSTQPAQRLNFATQVQRSNATQRPPRVPAVVERLGHLVLQSTKYRESLDWYLQHLGLIVSDFLYYEGQRERGPTMSFIRCDRGAVLTDHHTLALTLGPTDRYVHSAYQVADLDALAAGGEYLRERGYQRSWGIGRHIQGSQIFDYWRDPDGVMVEHFTDGDLFDHTVPPEWAPMKASGLAQWGPPPTKDFLGLSLRSETMHELRSMLAALGNDNEFDFARMRGLMKVATT